jgi:hypothetical protein
MPLFSSAGRLGRGKMRVETGIPLGGRVSARHFGRTRLNNDEGSPKN